MEYDCKKNVVYFCINMTLNITQVQKVETESPIT